MKKLLFSLLSLISANVANAEMVPGMQLLTKTGSVDIALSDIKTISYPSESTVLFTMENSSTSMSQEVTFLLSDINRIIFLDIESSQSDIQIVSDPEQNACALYVYGLDGEVIAIQKNGNQLDETLNRLQAGTYLLRCGNKCMKVVKK